jgi:hypothetical protein
MSEKSAYIQLKDSAGNIVREYKEVVLLVNTYHADGTPRNCTLIADDHTVDLAGGEHFIIALVSKDVMKMGRPKR